MNYEVQQALSKKVDDWKFHVLEQKVSSLEIDNREQGAKLGNLEVKVSNHYQAIERLLQIMAEKEIFNEYENELSQIRQYL